MVEMPSGVRKTSLKQEAEIQKRNQDDKVSSNHSINKSFWKGMPIPVQALGGKGKGKMRGSKRVPCFSQSPDFKATFGPTSCRIWDILLNSLHLGSEGKESACNAGGLDSIPGLERSPGGGHGSPLHYSCLEKPHGQRSLVATVLRVAELDMTE